ncbi:ATP-binding protein [Kitasatospora sp. MAP5-34]|uniref:ATP-binding protein n=1 Tax=Kitasatospora sp. MAP5-34 TaxID=3035102 RepID=UPI0024732414|nr:ATP-binding protein [Kitasatospora sp. MAP5-34]
MPHGAASVAVARRRLRSDLGEREIPDTVIDDAVLILSELLSNSCRYARPLGLLAELDDRDAVRVGAHAPTRRGSGSSEADHRDSDHRDTGHRDAGPRDTGHRDADHQPGGVLVRWQMLGDGSLTLEVTDGGAVTRPHPARPSLTSRGGRGLSIVGKLATAWGVRDAPGRVTVWAALRPERPEHAEHAARSA